MCARKLYLLLAFFSLGLAQLLLLGGLTLVASNTPPATRASALASLQDTRFEEALVSAIVLPEPAFLEAMASPHFQVDRGTAQHAVTLTAQANRPGTRRAVIAVGEAGSKAFAGTLFLVVRDPVSLQRGQRVTVRDYYVAAVELKGQAAWVGSTVGFEVDIAQASSASASGSCCGPTTVCVPDAPQPGGCGPDGLCTGPDLGVPSTMPTGPGWQQNASAPPVPLKVFRSGSANLQDTSFAGACVDRTLNRSCGISKPYCEPGDTGFFADSGGASIDTGSACRATSRPVNGREMPEWCQYALFDSPNAPECQGSRFEGILQSLTRVAGSETLPEDYVPPMCDRARVTEDSNICTTAREQQARKALEESAMRMSFALQGGKRCEATGRQVHDARGLWGLQECTECEPGLTGHCRRWNELKSIDTADAAASESSKKPQKQEVNFPAEMIIVRVKATEVQKEQSVNAGTLMKLFDPAENQGIKATGATPQSPDPNKPKPNSGANASGTRAINQPTGRADGKKSDPILLGDGSFDLAQTDLSYPGPAYALDFTRSYNSRSEDRGTLGSNWVHNWDIWLEPLGVHNTPKWAMPYCLGTDSGARPSFEIDPSNAEARVTCIVFHRGDGSRQLFFLDLGTRLYLPQAGSTDTISTTVDRGWVLRTSDGEIWRFNSTGYLVSRRDRFGNGFELAYEPTPLWEMYTRYCTAAELQQRNETKYGRRCAFIAYLVGDGPQTSGLPGWQVTGADYPLPGDPDLRQRLDYAVAYFLDLNARGTTTLPSYGTRRMRVTRVTDDVGRSLVFNYAHASRCVPPQFCGGGSRYDFDGTPHAELLERVDGPAGATLTFSYAPAPQTPAGFLETFLTGILRTDAGGAVDVVPAASRSFTYHYQWPGGPVASFPVYSQKVYDAYRAFYATFLGCGFVPLGPCGERGRPQIASGNADPSARLEQFAYISDVIDNIIRVDDTPLPSAIVSAGPRPSIQSETRFEFDPWSGSFDRAYAQRYGSSLAQQDPSRIAPDRPGDNWASTLPKATFTYMSASIAKLPRQIHDRYPLEPQPPAPSTTLVPPVASLGRTAKSSSCDYARMEQLRPTLPGWTPPVEYFDAPASTARVGLALAATPLSCEQLSAGTYGDPTHNDLMSSLEPISNTPELSDHFARRIVGRRAITAVNGNRVCAWTQMRDRDGDLHVYGMNFRGQILIDAVEERRPAGQPASGTFLYAETVYNADGMPTERRRTVRGTHRWQTADGSDRLTYDEIDPTGNRGWNEWLPAFWARRLNLLRLEVRPRGGEVVDFDENATAFVAGAGRYTTFAYEPLFNQVRQSEFGALVRATNSSGAIVLTDVPHEKTTVTFDYQELSTLSGAPPDRSIVPVLDSVREWGYGWTTTLTGTYDLPDILIWQLPLAFYNDDLNGDGLIGFGAGVGAGRLARGVPVAVMREGNDPAYTPQMHLLAWAPHGQMSALAGPDGDLTLFEYYSRKPGAAGAGFGGTAPPANADVSSDRAGFLGRTRALRFAPYAAGAAPGIAPCPLLLGPYQALLPPACTNPPTELARLGLPPQAIDAIVAATRAAQSLSDPERYETSAQSYNETGHPRYLWSESQPFHYIRDTDGRATVETTPRGVTLTTQYSVRGFPVQVSVADSAGQVLAEITRTVDAEGALVGECVARVIGGCASTPRAGNMRSLSYTPEGALQESIDHEGLVSRFEYDERGLLTSQRSRNPAHPADVPMRTTFRYDEDGNLREAVHAPARPEQQTESFEYDGLQRLTTYTDLRGYAWQSAYTSRDRLARRKRDDRPYRFGAPAPASWETVLSYDSFNYHTRQQHNGIETLRLRRTAGGRVFAHSASGVGQTIATFDRTGRPAWMRDPAGTVTVFTHRTAGTERTTTTIRGTGAQQRLTTATIVELDAAGQPVRQVAYGRGQERQTRWIRDGLGRVTVETDHEGFATRQHYDLTGFMRTSEQQRTVGATAQFDVTTYEPNARSQIVRIIDPAKQVTDFEYDGFGRLRRRQSPGQPGVVTAFTYDGLGRGDTETIGANQIRHVYDHRGDPIEDWWVVSPKPVMIGERTFDDLGRVRTTKNTNPAVPAMPPSRRIVTQELSYDVLGRVDSDSLRVGLSAAHPVRSDWAIAAGGLWERTLSYDLGTNRAEWLETFDVSRRLTRMRSSAGPSTDFQWLGDLYAGRDQQQTGWQSPLRERLLFDRFGRPVAWRYSAIDLDAGGRPVFAQDASAYCGGTWIAAECSRPLLAADAMRDAMGRVVSLQSSFGHPSFTGGTLVRRPALRPWRGYTYDPMGRLAGLWEHAGVGTAVDTQGLSTHSVQPADIQKIGAAADALTYDREIVVGGTMSIRNAASGDERLVLTSPRGPGHQLQQVRIDRTPRALQHDAAGRVREDGALMFSFDPRGQLAAVTRNGQIVETYFYDLNGRLAAIGSAASGAPTQVFAYDGAQMVAAFASTNQPRWEAVWGPGVDRLLSWRDLTTGIEQFVVADPLNSVAAAWDPAAGRVTATADYDPEGRLELRNAAGVTTCVERGTGNVCASPGRMPFAYGSLWRSATTGLVYMRNRWYSPELSQFLSQDPLGYADSYNSYAYAGFDPINQGDAFGANAAEKWPADAPVRQRPPLRLVPRPPAEAPTNAGRMMGRAAGRAAFVAGLLIPTNDTSPSCTDDFCKSLGEMDGWDSRTGQRVTSSEMDARMSLPEAHPKAPGPAPAPSVPENPVASGDYRARFLQGIYRRLSRELEIGDVCEFCSEATTEENPPQVEHFIALQHLDALVRDGLLTEDDALEIADSLGEFFIACRRCNLEKSNKVISRPLFEGDRRWWWPKNPNARVRAALEALEGRGIPGTGVRPPAGTPKPRPGLKVPGGAPAAACSPKDLACQKK